MTFELAERHERYDKMLEDAVMRQEESLVKAKATEEARKLYNLHREVAREYDKTRSFVRLEMSKHGILYGRVECRHHVEDLVLNHFIERFPSFVIALGSPRGCWIGSHKLGICYRTKQKMNKVLDYLEKILPEEPMLEYREIFDRSIWESYYASQYINERKNIRLFLQFMPKKYHHLDSITKTFGNRKIEEYA